VNDNEKRACIIAALQTWSAGGEVNGDVADDLASYQKALERMKNGFCPLCGDLPVVTDTPNQEDDKAGFGLCHLHQALIFPPDEPAI